MKHLALLAAVLAAGAAQAAERSQPKVQARDAWCRAAPAGAPTGGCYVTLVAPSDDRLVGVATPAAQRVEVHTMDMTGGVMRMRPSSDGTPLPAGQLVELKPGARHLMVIGPKATLAAGGVVPLTLRFAKAQPLTVNAPIRAAAPAAMPAMGHP
jgi:copper(I)-binding protein